MKKTLVLCIALSAITITAQATASKHVRSTSSTTAPVATTPTSASLTPSSTTTVLEPTTTIKNIMYLSTNFLDLTKGNGNISGDFFITENAAANISVRSISSREKVKVATAAQPIEMTVDKAYYILGASFFPLGLNKQINLLLSPGLAFGTKKTTAAVETITGLNLKASALIKTANKVSFELGLQSNNLDEGSFVSEAYAGLGLLF